VNESEVIDVSGKTEILGRKIIIKSEQWTWNIVHFLFCLFIKNNSYL
jgi:hypothetical protein